MAGDRKAKEKQSGAQRCDGREKNSNGEGNCSEKPGRRLAERGSAEEQTCTDTEMD